MSSPRRRPGRFAAVQGSNDEGGRPEGAGRRVAQGLAAAMMLPLLAAGVVVVSPDVGATPSVASAETIALTAAVSSGEPVEVVSARDEYSQVFATPEGQMRLDLSAAPLWARGDDGQWHRPDSTVVVRPDGSIGPRYGVVGVSFSKGGPGPMVTLTKGRDAVDFGWPGGALPTPVLAGDQATYPEVWPGVDLRLVASAEGFRPILVVKSALAAKLPQLRKLSFRMASATLTARQVPGGGFELRDAAGAMAFAGSTGVMWDSAGDKSARTTTVAVGEPAMAGIEGPVGGDAVKRVPVQAAASAWALSPDPEWLTSTARQFPLFLDPTTGVNPGSRTMLSSGGWSEWKRHRRRGLGKCGTWNGYYCGDGFVKRMFFQFSQSQNDKLDGKIIRAATFRITETWLFQCSPRCG